MEFAVEVTFVEALMEDSVQKKFVKASMEASVEAFIGASVEVNSLGASTKTFR